MPLLFGADALTSTYWKTELWLLGEVSFVSSTIFDIGVYLVVVGLVLDVLRSLGAEVDRQGDDASDRASGRRVDSTLTDSTNTDSTKADSTKEGRT